MKTVSLKGNLTLEEFSFEIEQRRRATEVPLKAGFESESKLMGFAALLPGGTAI